MRSLKNHALRRHKQQSIMPGLVVCFASALVFAFLPFWPLVLISGLAGGWLAATRVKAAIIGFLGVTAAWLVYMLIQWQWDLVSQIAWVIIGSKGLAPVLVVIILLSGGFLGLLGSVIGKSVRMAVS